MAWQRIQDRATTITVYRDGAALAGTQTVRIEYSTIANERRGAGEASVRDIVLFGVMDHPDVAVTDTNLKKDDQFSLADGIYRVLDVIVIPGEVQARAERIS
jgi:hypothetical protein